MDEKKIINEFRIVQYEDLSVHGFYDGDETEIGWMFYLVMRTDKQIEELLKIIFSVYQETVIDKEQTKVGE